VTAAAAATLLATLLATMLTGTAARASSSADAPPTAPLVGYAEGFQCTMLIVGIQKSTDDTTPQSQLRYQVYSDGVPLEAPLTDTGYDYGVWGVLHFTTLAAGYHTVSVRAIDAAGHQSVSSKGVSVREYYTPGCTPGHL